MKQAFLSLLMVTLAFVGAKAQQIAVVSESGTTTLYRTLQAAIEGAEGGSVVYLPGGGFAISDDVRINKKLTIVGIGHKAKGENPDGNTVVSGNLSFNEGSDGSAVMGCYVSGSIHIAREGEPVHDITVKYCNLDAIEVHLSACTGTFVNQNYIRNGCFLGDSEGNIKNNILPRLEHINGGVISNNVFTYPYGSIISYAYSSTIVDNVFRKNAHWKVENVVTSNNLCPDGGTWGENPIVIDADANDFFVNVNDWQVSTVSDFHFTDAYKQYESQCGIYAGTGFDDSALPPVPYIVSKAIADRTDAAGKLKINIRVKASE